MEPKRRSALILRGRRYVPLLDRLHRAWRGTDLRKPHHERQAAGRSLPRQRSKDSCSLADHADHLAGGAHGSGCAQAQRAVHVDRDADSPGVSMTPIRGLGDNNISAVYFENVQVPLENLVGTEGGGGASSLASSTTSAGVVRSRSARAALGGDARACSRCGGRRRDPAARSPWVRRILVQVRAWARPFDLTQR